MSDLFITGWKAGLQTISLIRLVRANSAMGLKEATQAVRELMGGKAIHLSGLTDARAAELRKEIENLNAICHCTPCQTTKCDDMSDEPASLDEYAYLWDGSEPGHVLIKAPRLGGGHVIFNRLRGVLLHVEDESLNALLCERLRDGGCEVFDKLPENRGHWDPSSD